MIGPCQPSRPVDRAAAVRVRRSLPRRGLHRRRSAGAARRLGVRRARPRRAGAGPPCAQDRHGADALSWRGCSSWASTCRCDAVRRELPLDDLVALGLVERRRGTCARVVDVRPYGESDTDWYVVSDHGPDSPGRPGTRGRRRPRARRRRGVADAGAHHAARTRSAGRSTSAPAAGCRRCTSDATRAASSRPTATGARCGSPP